MIVNLMKKENIDLKILINLMMEILNEFVLLLKKGVTPY